MNSDAYGKVFGRLTPYQQLELCHSTNGHGLSPLDLAEKILIDGLSESATVLLEHYSKVYKGLILETSNLSGKRMKYLCPKFSAVIFGCVVFPLIARA